jgi:hypothetical protein
MRTLFVQVVSLVLVIASLIVLPISLFLGWCGFAGGLSDTSVWENQVVGLWLLGIAGRIILMDTAWLFCLLRNGRKSA